ncbi:MAG: isoleucine--tRNA ligase [Candidatus Aerophobetes bacterium]|nr:isoleucine--tRNA ligase [Candidatus Aerophobetes bacterium]
MDYSKTLNLPQTEFKMRASLPQKEKRILNFWEEKKLYEKIRKKSAHSSRYTLHDGPPYANGDIHLGQALNKVIKDMVVKYKILQGFDAPFIPGWDCHGLPVEHQLFRELGVKKEEISQLEFRQLAREYALRFVNRQKEEFKRLGVFGRWAKPYLTMDPLYEAEIIDSFGKLAREGYIYRGLKSIHWCFKCQTALAEAEIEYKEKSDPSIYVKFLAKDNFQFLPPDIPVYILIWTTTPWTLPANLGIALHPHLSYSFVAAEESILLLAEDLLERVKKETGIKKTEILSTVKGKELEGEKYIHPLTGKEARILLADFVTLEEGTGCVHTAPGHGEEDYFLGLKYNLPVFSPVDDEGRFTSEVEEFKGIPVFKANSLIMEKLEEEGFLLHKGTIYHSYPHCWRCGSPLIFRATPQWFLSVDKNNLRNRTIEAVVNDVEWIPQRGKGRMKNMLEERPDWCLSRQRYWGIGIPVIYCLNCGKAIIEEDIIQKVKSLTAGNGSDVWFKKKVEEFIPSGFKCPECGGKRFTKEKDIIDVWFESGISHQAVVFQENSLQDPADLYIEGSDQHRGWFQTSILTSIALKERAPYRKVLTHGFVVDSEGKKMSKSIGNVVDPQRIVEERGADILRLWVSLEDYTQDIRISKEIIGYTIEVYRRIRNSFRFLLGNLYDFNPLKDSLPLVKMREVDRWMLSYFQQVIKKVKDSFEAFKFYEAVRFIHNFEVNELSSFYFDILKDRLYTLPANCRGRKSAQTVLYQLLVNLTKLIAPVLPFTSEEVWNYVKAQKEESVFLSSWPKIKKEWIDKDLEEKWSKILKVREKALKELEECRQNKEITSSLQAKIIIKTPSSIFSVLKSLDTQLNEVFIVSGVELIEDTKLEITVKKAEGKKCERCWNYSSYVGKDKTYPTLCERCCKTMETNFK